MNQWCYPVRSSLVHSEDPYSSPYQAVIHTKNSLMHYGIKGQKWGVITKEYEPVAIDHRKLKKTQTPNHSITTRPRNARSQLTRRQQQQMARREREGYYTTDRDGRTVWRQNGKTFSPAEKRHQLVQKALIGGAIMASLIAAFGVIKYKQVRRNKAYAGILNRFLTQNPGANMSSSAGRKLYKQGMQLAKANSSSKTAIKSTNSYLKRKGLEVGAKKASSMYRGRKAAEKQLNYALNRKNALAFLRKLGRL